MFARLASAGLLLGIVFTARARAELWRIIGEKIARCLWSVKGV